MRYGKAITRDGFTSSFGRFRTTRGDNERVEPLSLRSMFVPKLSREGQKMLRDRTDFVLSQLQHYGVPFKESQISGTGERLMRKIIQKGKCDAVPAHILALEEQLHQKWLSKCDMEALSYHPDWVMQKYFVPAHEQNSSHKRTTTVIGVFLPRFVEDRSGPMREAAYKVEGLHHQTVMGSEKRAIFLGWDGAAVMRAANQYANVEVRNDIPWEQMREIERAEMHAEYLDKLKRMKGAEAQKAKSPVGSYIVDCEEIENQWSDLADDMTLDIHDTEQKGTFHATFDFGVVAGVMIISEGDMMESEEEGDCGVEDDDDYGRPGIKNKRKPIASKRGRPSKKAKAGKAQTCTYRLKHRCRKYSEGEIFSHPEHGTMRFEDGNFATLTAKVGFPCVGPSVTFTARKVCDYPELSDEKWDDYSEEAYEYE
ncbi:hypothetical protein ASPBRDRAFT_31298 [Aspergillus brasiliensis CBS 101740]|uniref:Uncharacterized protein n=1 Tax=Aspergillus brasiliensis (strain CBS 101740 / IMI 381727 / IBT 21946) TaxID=767769 RepID=A0A1L9UFH6_ASPBC|nr:hypothetical protein ASPBRDRAFT_31298 [Aspergillus brasiliensis CBS 101740]